MAWTTKVKIFLKKHLPLPLFTIIRFFADFTILKIESKFFQYRVSSFKKRAVKKIFYKNKSFDIVINPQNGYLDAQIYVNGLYEPHIVREIVNNTPQMGVCLDIGANIGHHTIIMSQCVGEEGRVFAFEPIPRIREQIKESLALNNIKNVTIVPDALSNKEGEVSLCINDDNVGGSSLVNTGGGKKITIRARTLDSYDYDRVDFMKIDVEGFEYNVLLGGTKLIQEQHPVVLFEYSPLYYEKFDPSHSKKILTFFKEHNYALFDLEDNKKEITNIEEFVKEFGKNLRSQTNILAK